MSEVVVVALITPAPGNEEAVTKAFTGLVEPTHKEDGCHLYAVHRDNEVEGRLVFIERWESAEHLAAHATSAHFTACVEAVGALLAEPPTIIRCTAWPLGDATLGVL